jgi:class 3 adenylate cyclase
MNTEQQIIAQVLAALRRWGWETGLAKLETEVGAAFDDAGRATLWQVQDLLTAGRPAGEGMREHLQKLDDLPALRGWALVGQALAALRKAAYKPAHQLLDQASRGASADTTLRATVAHYRGAVLFHEGQDDAALPHLHEALELFGPEHFVTGRVLDTLGMVYAAKDNFATAFEFFERAIGCKEVCRDELGLAVSHGQLGRLALDWGDLAEAEKHFKADLEIARRLEDSRGAALMYGHLGRVALARERAAEASGYLDESIRRSQQGGWPLVEGYARKDRALAYLTTGDLAAAERELDDAKRVFQGEGFAEGLAHVNRVRGQLLKARGLYDEADRILSSALAHFQAHGERAELARTEWERARILRARGAPAVVVADALRQALDTAEECRRHVLVRDIEAELRQVDEAAYCRHVYQRARGRAIGEDMVSLFAGDRETATVLFLDLQGSSHYVRSTDPQVVLVTLNQMMADFAGVLERHGVTVTTYLGDGFMALVRGRDHARRGLTAALDLAAALAEFNRPRQVLGLPLLNARMGLSTGEVCVGNVGTYDKMDFTALGLTVHLAARLQTEAEPGQPCLSQATYEQVQEHFEFRPGNPRMVELKGLGRRQVWDVVGRRKNL